MERLENKGDLVVAVVGVTGAVGRKMLELLAERSFPVRELRPLASARSSGRTVTFASREHEVRPLDAESFEDVDLAFFAAGGSVSREHVPRAARAGAVVVDKSSVFRMEPDVPLVVPECNAADIETAERHIIANPNCSTSQLIVPLAPLHAEAGLTRLVVDTYQAVSGAGVAGVEELTRGTRARLEDAPAPECRAVARPIAFNAVAHIDAFGADGFTGEELKVVNETRKIMHLPHLPVTCTAVRVPVYVGHSEAVTMEFERPLDPERARRILSSTPGVVVMDDPSRAVYPTALDCEDRDEVLVGRIRRDLSCPRGLHMWVVADNLRKGAATNAVQIAEHAAGIAR
jgi:aspartate-semialdehyde dehydrogenase